MAHDTRRVKTFKWLQTIAEKSRFDVMVYYGSIYVTDEILLAKIDYPEFEHLSDGVWSRITRVFDDNGYALSTPEIEPLDRQIHNNRIFDDMFVNQLSRFDYGFDCAYMRKALKPFEINRIHPTIATDENKIMLLGHNKDVSIRVVFMGMKI